MNYDGFLLLERSILDSKVFASEKALKIWIWLLAKANYEQRHVPVRVGAGQSVVTIARGQLLFGRFKAEDELNIDGSTIYKILKQFETDERITIESNSHYSVITICNYDSKQRLEYTPITPDEQPNDSQVTTPQQHRNNTVTHLKNNNQLKNTIIKEIPVLEFSEHLRTERMKEKFSQWQICRRAMKKPKDWTVLFNEQIAWLGQFTEPEAFEILSASIRNGWQGLFKPKNSIFELKTDTAQKRRNYEQC
jgi:hypothetical protein